MTASRAERLAGAAPWILGAVLAVAAVACAGVVTVAVTGLASAFLAPPPLQTREWLARVLGFTEQEFALGTASAWLALAVVVVAAVATGARVAPTVRAPSIARAIPLAVGGLALVAAWIVLAPSTALPTAQDAGTVTLLIGDGARGALSPSVALGSAGMLVLAVAGGAVAASDRRAAVACGAAAVAAAVGCLRAVTLAAVPYEVLRAAPAYPAQILQPDVVASALAPPLALGAIAFGIAALAGSAVRLRRQERTPRSFVGESGAGRPGGAPGPRTPDETAG